MNLGTGYTAKDTSVGLFANEEKKYLKEPSKWDRRSHGTVMQWAFKYNLHRMQFKSHQKSKMAALISKIFWLQFCTLGGMCWSIIVYFNGHNKILKKFSKGLAYLNLSPKNCT